MEHIEIILPFLLESTSALVSTEKTNIFSIIGANVNMGKKNLINFIQNGTNLWSILTRAQSTHEESDRTPDGPS